MALIKCPHCGHTVLSVASTCPGCSQRLAVEPEPSYDRGQLVRCGRCGELVARGDGRCPHCGYARRARLAQAVGAAAAAAALLAAAWYIAHREPDEIVSTTPVVVSLPLPSVPPDSGQAPLLLPEPVPISPPVTQPASRPAVVTTARWTTNWANVRSAPGVGGDIVRILRPGTSVNVGSRRGGWWMVYEADSLLGYVSAELLDTIPPREPT